MELSNLRPAEGSKHSDNFRRGRGHGSGNGKTAGKGHKGQKARSGAPRPGFEGGQMPLYRRLPKRGFKNRNRLEIVAINISALEKFDNGADVTVDGINAAMKAAASESFGYNTDPIVSSDVIGMRYGSLFDSTQTMVSKIADDLYEVQVVSWYDNENSYTSQMVRTIKYFSELA